MRFSSLTSYNLFWESGNSIQNGDEATCCIDYLSVKICTMIRHVYYTKN